LHKAITTKEKCANRNRKTEISKEKRKIRSYADFSFGNATI